MKKHDLNKNKRKGSKSSSIMPESSKLRKTNNVVKSTIKLR